MILVTPSINSAQNIPKFNFSNKSKINYIQQDTFQRQMTANPSFGCIPRAKIFKLADDVMKQTAELTDSTKIGNIVNDFFANKLTGLLHPALNTPEKELNTFMDFRHELISKFVSKHELITNTNLRDFVSKLHPDIVTDEQYVSFQKNEFKELAKGIKNCSNKWSQISKWRFNPDKKFHISEVFELAEQMLDSKKHPKISITGKELLNNKFVGKPEALYNLLCETIKNAIKHSDGKPTEVRIEKLKLDERMRYYASFITEGAKPISESKIDKILSENLNTEAHRLKSSVKDSEYEFLTMIKMIKESWGGLNLTHLIKRNCDKGVCVQIPLVVINN